MQPITGHMHDQFGISTIPLIFPPFLNGCDIIRLWNSFNIKLFEHLLVIIFHDMGFIIHGDGVSSRPHRCSVLYNRHRKNRILIYRLEISSFILLNNLVSFPCKIFFGSALSEIYRARTPQIRRSF